ncbi:MAG: 5-formyltetrahydrofolate cyclo-ligase [Bacteroidaceae bacterium]|nr:5-formyltetrahydrofolate cyclo-ligase [Bacteroidaceae bacterium]
MNKQQIRRQLTQLRNQLYESGSLPNQASEVVEQLERHPLFQQAERVLLFHSLPDEVDTHALIEHYKDKKTIILPTVVGDELELHLYDPSSTTHEGAFHIQESSGPIIPETEYGTINLAIIPGVAFDQQGNRLGRGKGYYDRLLPKLTCYTIGICYPHQFIDKVPHEPHDIPVDEVIY